MSDEAQYAPEPMQQDQRDQAHAAQVAATVRHCLHYVVLEASGKMECRALMVRPDFDWPVPVGPKYKQMAAG